MDTTDVPEVMLPPADLHAALAHATHKRMCYPWNDWGRRTSYTELVESGAALVDAWADTRPLSRRQPASSACGYA
jgi:hypothetical protein